MIFLYVFCKDINEAKTIGTLLVTHRAAGKVDIIPVQSMFRQKEGVQEREGAAMIIQTIDKRIRDVEDIVRQHQVGRTSCVASFTLYRLNREFKDWLIASTA